jgi:hypothetical protein
MYITYQRTLSYWQKEYNDPHILCHTEKEYEWLIFFGAKFDSVLYVQL